MPDVIEALYEDATLGTIEVKDENPVIEKVEESINEEVKVEDFVEDNKIEEPSNEPIEMVSAEEIKPIVISSTKVEITSPNSISREMKKISFEKFDNLMASLQAEIDRYYDLINGVVNNG
jgi:hypothetical protein